MVFYVGVHFAWLCCSVSRRRRSIRRCATRKSTNRFRYPHQLPLSFILPRKLEGSPLFGCLLMIDDAKFICGSPSKLNADQMRPELRSNATFLHFPLYISRTFNLSPHAPTFLPNSRLQLTRQPCQWSSRRTTHRLRDKR